MKPLRRRTREAHRHDRAVVLQELGARADDPRAWQSRQRVEVSRMLEAERKANRAPACDKCNDQAGGCWYCGRG